jgi:hypothetical protein
MCYFKNYKVFVTTFSPKIYLGKFSSYHNMILKALSAIFFVGIKGNLPLYNKISSYFIANNLSLSFLNYSNAYIA